MTTAKTTDTNVTHRRVQGTMCACINCESDDPRRVAGSIYCHECRDCGLTDEQYREKYPDEADEVLASEKPR